MPKKIIGASLVLSFVLSASPVFAVPSFFQSVQLSTPGTDRILVLPSAAGHSSVISLGTSVDPASGKVVEGYAVIHYKKGGGHKGTPHGRGNGGPGNGGGDTSSCFSFLAKDAKWKTVEPWVVNPTNNEGLSNSFVFSNLTADITKWEGSAASDILGGGSETTDVLVADSASPDGVNEVYFADISSPGAIAVTIVWGIFGGPPFARELVEWDLVFNEVDYDWSSTGEAGKMDFENITTHELGHAVGMGHPEDSCTEETMYRFADFGETKKRTLEAGDIAGIQKLY